jgi:Mn2+/Fe2+ NRAMP family transporter
MLTDIILILITVIGSIIILSLLVLYADNKYDINFLNILNILVLIGIVYLLFLQNNQIKNVQTGPVPDSQTVENMNAYLTLLSPLIPMVDKENHPITYPPT